MIDLNGNTATSTTRQIINLAETAGLRPHIETPHRGSYRVLFSAPGADGLFGGLYVGARSGRIQRGYLTHGNHGEERRYDHVADIRTVIKSWAALQRDAAK